MRTLYTKEVLEAAVKNSLCISDVIRHLGKRWNGGTHTHVKRRLIAFDIDTSHFLGSGVGIGSRHRGGSQRRDWQDILKLRTGGRREKAHRLRRALIEAGVPHVCTICRIANIWNNKPIVLEINHKNSNNIDDRLENLEFLCPNCHSQIPNHTRVAER